jgi:hypothetical protein
LPVAALNGHEPRLHRVQNHQLHDGTVLGVADTHIPVLRHLTGNGHGPPRAHPRAWPLAKGVGRRLEVPHQGQYAFWRNSGLNRGPTNDPSGRSVQDPHYARARIGRRFFLWIGNPTTSGAGDKCRRGCFDAQRATCAQSVGFPLAVRIGLATTGQLGPPQNGSCKRGLREFHCPKRTSYALQINGVPYFFVPKKLGPCTNRRIREVECRALARPVPPRLRLVCRGPQKWKAWVAMPKSNATHVAPALARLAASARTRLAAASFDCQRGLRVAQASRRQSP